MAGRLLFLNPPGPRFLYRGTVCTYLSKARYVWKPKDFILASGKVPADWEVRFVDAAIRKLDADAALGRLGGWTPDRILMALSSIHWEGDLAFLKRVREAFPKAHLTVFGEVLLEASYREQARAFSDAALFNPVLYDVASSFFPERDAKPVKAGTPVELSTPRHDLFDYWRYRWPFTRHFRYAAVYTQYGCPYSCSYCTESITSVTYRPAEGVLEELRGLRTAGYRELHLGDSSFGFPKANADRILRGMIDERMGFSWSCYTYPGLADRETLGLMKDSGCHTVVIGIDAADSEMLRKYGRRLDPVRLERFLKDCRELRIDVCGDLILGFDEDTEESCRKTVRMALDADLDYASINIATPLFGSSLREKARSENRLDARANGFDTAGNTVLGSAAIPGERLRAIRREANRAFYLRPGYLWKRLRKVESLEHFAIQGLEAVGLAENYFRHLVGTNASLRPGE